jgi:hypothetical protein
MSGMRPQISTSFSRPQSRPCQPATLQVPRTRRNSQIWACRPQNSKWKSLTIHAHPFPCYASTSASWSLMGKRPYLSKLLRNWESPSRMRGLRAAPKTLAMNLKTADAKKLWLICLRCPWRLISILTVREKCLRHPSLLGMPYRIRPEDTQSHLISKNMKHRVQRILQPHHRMRCMVKRRLCSQTKRMGQQRIKRRRQLTLLPMLLHLLT